MLKTLYAEYTFAFAAGESGLDPGTIAQVADLVASAGTRLSTHTWRSAAAGNLGGWQVSRTLFLLNALTGSIGTEGGTWPNAWNKYVPRPMYVPDHPHAWNELTWPIEYPLAMNELSFLLPHLLKERRGRLEVYFTRVYNPVWTNPDGFSWIEALTDEAAVGLHVALTPTWSETAFFADYILPVGHGPERHDLHWYRDAQRPVDRLQTARAARLPRAPGPARHRHAAGEPRRGLGGERVLDRSHLAHRPGRPARHQEVRRVARSPRREALRRRVPTASSSSTPSRACPSAPRRRG